MATDSLKQVGRIIRRANNQASLALKRDFRSLPKKDRARDTVSSVYPFRMTVDTDKEGGQATMNINFNKPPPEDCAADCRATACEEFELIQGGYSLQVNSPYEAGTVRAYSNGAELTQIQWYEENPSAGQVYVQVQDVSAMIVICYTYIIC